MRVRYPRTPHLPWSPGATRDDVRAESLAGLAGREVVVTEKLDGENTTLYRDGLHARSLDSAHHPSRAWVKALHGRIAARIPEGWRVCGENVYARHSLGYHALESWLYALSVWTEDDRCLDWDETVRFTRRLGVPVPPVLYRGPFDERVLRALRIDPARQEGYVVRTTAGFARQDFPRHVAKWVRGGHVQTSEHWMLQEVIENGRGPAAALWDVRSGAHPAAELLCAAIGGVLDGASPAAVEDVSARLDALGRTGDARLAGVLAALLHRAPRPALLAELAGSIGMPLARRVADLVGLHVRLRRPFPDAARRAGLVRWARGVDVGVLHAVAAASLAGSPRDAEADAAREQVAWSELVAGEAGLLEEAPLAALRRGLRERLAGLDRSAADRCWAEAVSSYAEGRVHGVEDAEALTWRWRAGRFPRLVMAVGPSGSGKSHFVDRVLRPTGATVVSLDELREARGSRADQSANAEVLREGLDRLDAALAAGESVVWDATSLHPQHRSLPLGVARARDALTTCAVLVVPFARIAERNADREHAVPDDVLAEQLARYAPPYPGEVHRVWYVDARGDLADIEGSLDAEDA